MRLKNWNTSPEESARIRLNFWREWKCNYAKQPPRITRTSTDRRVSRPPRCVPQKSRRGYSQKGNVIVDEEQTKEIKRRSIYLRVAWPAVKFPASEILEVFKNLLRSYSVAPLSVQTTILSICIKDIRAATLKYYQLLKRINKTICCQYFKSNFEKRVDFVNVKY